jgi:hypothetical protein
MLSNGLQLCNDTCVVFVWPPRPVVLPQLKKNNEVDEFMWEYATTEFL